jgi:hypothetical protein
MSAPRVPPAGGPAVAVVAGTSPEVVDAERELDAAGVPLPVQSRVTWTRHLGSARDRTVLVRDADGRPVAMATIAITRTRALPGHVVGRIESFGDPFAGPAGVALLTEAARYARRHGWMLRLVVELECRDQERRECLVDTLQALGFARIPSERAPARTLVIPLTDGEEAVFARFGRSTRQNIRGAAKHGLALVPIEGAQYGPRMSELLDRTMERTGGMRQVVDWSPILRACRELPHRLRLVGVFRGESRDPADLLGFAWGLHHGERAEYHTGASARVPGVRLPLLYPILWDLISWARREGATWFDLGGVTAGAHGTDDALGGISDFKRGFSKEEIALGQEWALEPSRLRSWVAGTTSRAMRTARQLLHARRQRQAAPAAGGAAEPATVPDGAPASPASDRDQGR